MRNMNDSQQVDTAMCIIGDNSVDASVQKLRARGAGRFFVLLHFGDNIQLSPKKMDNTWANKQLSQKKRESTQNRSSWVSENGWNCQKAAIHTQNTRLGHIRALRRTFLPICRIQGQSP